MADSRIRIQTLSDQRVIELFRRLSSCVQGTPKTITATPYLGSQFQVAASQDEVEREVLGDAASTQRLRNVSLHAQSRIMVSWMRGGGDGTLLYQDELHVKDENKPLQGEERTKLLAVLDEFKDPPAEVHRLRGMPDELLASQMAAVDRMKQVLADLVVRQQAAYLELEKQLQDRFAKREEDLQKVYEVRNGELNERAAALEQIRAEIDVRDNTIARRARFEQILAELAKRQESFSLTRDTNSKRIPIHVACVGSGSAFLALALFLPHEDIGGLPGYVTLLAPTLALIGIATFYLRWLNRWFDRHSEAEFKLKQFVLDMERANWLVESALEWFQTNKEPLPEELISGLSRRLFVADNEAEELPLHPAEQLASAILGRASALRLKTGDAELEFDRKGIRELRR